MSYKHIPAQCNLLQLMQDTSYNDTLRHHERRREFNVSGLKRLAALAVERSELDIIRFEKLAEGGFNRTFIITMRDGYCFVARIPCLVTEPRSLLVASEVATMDFLRSHGIPVPKVLEYSATADNAAGTEYVFMDLVQGKNLGDMWFDMNEQKRKTIVTNLVRLETRLFNLRFPANSSIYYCEDLTEHERRVVVPCSNSTSRFCIGPDTSLPL